MRLRRTHQLAGLALTAVVLAGCSSGSEAGTSSSSAAATPTTASAASSGGATSGPTSSSEATSTGGATSSEATSSATTPAEITCEPASPLDGEFVIGAVLPLSGPLGAVGSNILLGMQAEACLLNQDGGILGQKVVIETRDSAGDGQQAVTAMRDLLAGGTVDAVIPDTIGPITAAVLPQVTEAGLLGATAAGSSGVGDKADFPTNFQFALLPAQQTKMMLAAAAGTGATKIGIVGLDDDTGRGYADLIQSSAAEFGLEVAGEPQFLDGAATDYTAQLQVLRDAGVEVIVGNLFGAPIGVLSQGLVDLGWSDAKIMGTPGFGSSPVDQLVPKEAWGQVFWASPPAGCFGPEGLSSTQQAFVAAVKATGGELKAMLGSAVGSDMLTGIDYAFEKAGSMDSAAAITAMEGMNDDPAATDLPWLFFGGQGPKFSGEFHTTENVDTAALTWVCHVGDPQSGAFPGEPLSTS
ncbi:ABC transporter substrate-binding protein [Nakamurella sp. YIM 132087]|uniref:ABC transporter substrate-binding protein n=1 Tax=Nakamurella alba TaxID=2665158 RepID=A0A7K1FJ01_9ACTN|nr:ABC transporter substrate-binding protein [Nakamurella alba]MTD14050.1 ABC transporter substrate-binding protein [Nakamurella alba]